MTEERVLKAIEVLLNKDCLLEEKGDDAYMYQLFYQLFGMLPYVDYFFDNNDDEDEEFDLDDIDDDLIQDKFNYNKTFTAIANKCPDSVVYTYKGYRILITDDFILFRGTIFHKGKERPKVCVENIMLDKEDSCNLIYISVDSRGNINKQLIPINKCEVNIQENYNDDCPYNKIEEHLSKDESSIMLLYGIPGSGKTYLLRKLILEHPELRFYWLDSSMFNMISSTEFSLFLTKCKNGIFILEDCERVIQSREDSHNILITPLLELSSGLIGGSLGLKFICTFNTDLKNVDPALQRKGRCSISYEFKKLNKNKVQALWDKLGIKRTATEDLALCDVLNVEEDNGVVKKKKIGF
jgi:hypothetical protein